MLAYHLYNLKALRRLTRYFFWNMVSLLMPWCECFACDGGNCKSSDGISKNYGRSMIRQ